MLWHMGMSFTYIRVLNIAVLFLKISRRLLLMEMRLTRVNWLSISPRYVMGTRTVVARVNLHTYRSVSSIALL
jgi:hypothetical protein